jgi:hypothetical protein
MMTFESLTPVFNAVVIPGIEPYMYSEDAVTKILKARERVEKVGSSFKVEVQIGYSEGVKNLASSAAALPIARQNKFESYTGTAKILAGRIKLDNGLLDDLANDPYKVLDESANEILGVKEVLKCEYERQSIADGGLTHLCTVASAAVNSESDTWVTVTVDNDADASSVKALCGPNIPTRYLRNGMIIDILASNHTSVSSTATESLEIGTVIDDVTFTIPCASNAAADTLAALLADGQLIYHEDGYNAELYGLKRIYGMTTGAFYDETDRSTAANAFLRPRVAYVSSAGRVTTGTPTGTATDNWSPANIHQMVQFLVDVKKAVKKDMLILCEEGVKARYIQKVKADNGYVMYDRKIDGWDYPVVEIDGVAIIDANYMFSNTMLFVPLNKHKKYLTREVDFRATKDGQIWAPVSGYDFQEAYLIGKMQMGSENIQQGGMLGDLKGQYDA